MGKRIWMIIAAFILLSGFALAEEYWTRPEDFYYHAYAGCLGAENMKPAEDISGKVACPVCMPISDMSAEIRAAERNGTLVLRIPEGWLNRFFDEYADIEPDEYNTIPYEYYGKTARLKVSEMLHGGLYQVHGSMGVRGCRDERQTSQRIQYGQGN